MGPECSYLEVVIDIIRVVLLYRPALHRPEVSYRGQADPWYELNTTQGSDLPP